MRAKPEIEYPVSDFQLLGNGPYQIQESHGVIFGILHFHTHFLD